MYTLPSKTVINNLAVATDVFDKVDTGRLGPFADGHTQHLTVLEFGCIPCNFLIHIYNLNVRKAGSKA
jgi:hypothetical protein